VIAPDAGNRELERGKIDKEIAHSRSKLSVFVCRKTGDNRGSRFGGSKNINYSCAASATIGCSTTLLYQGKNRRMLLGDAQA